MSMVLDPYVMSVPSKTFSFQSTGVNYALTYDSNSTISAYLVYGFMTVSALIVLVSFLFTLMNKKIMTVELLLSSQMVYFATLAANNSNSSLYPLTGLEYLAGYNNLSPFSVTQQNYKLSTLLSSGTYA